LKYLDAFHVSKPAYSSHQTNLLEKDVKLGGAPKAGFFVRLFSSGDANKKIHEFLKDHYSKLANYDDKIDIEETYICEGDRMFAIGTACEYEFEGKPSILVRKGANGVFCISDGDERAALSKISETAYLFLLFSPLLFTLCLSYFIWRLNALQLSPYLQIIALAFMYGYVLAMHFIEFFNSMVILRNQIDRAKANVDVLLARRSTLIPNLVSIVSAYAKHEKKAMEKIASLRSSAAASKSLIGIAENYPQLKANENFLSLQQELARTEDWIAGARIYVADSINLYNTRIQGFPYLLFAPLFKLKPIEQNAL